MGSDDAQILSMFWNSMNLICGSRDSFGYGEEDLVYISLLYSKQER